MRPCCGLIALCFTVACFAGASTSARLAADDTKKKKVGEDVVDLKSIPLGAVEKYVTAFKGKPVAMDVWATWCVPCREKFPKFVALAGKLEGKARLFSLTIDEEDQLAEAKKFLEKSKATFANFHAKEGAEAVEKKFGFEGVPHYVLWDADGKIVLRTSEITKLEEKLKELLPAKKEDK